MCVTFPFVVMRRVETRSPGLSTSTINKEFMPFTAASKSYSELNASKQLLGIRPIQEQRRLARPHLVAVELTKFVALDDLNQLVLSVAKAADYSR